MLEPGDESLGGALREAFASRIVEDGERPANYSMRLSDDPSRFHVLLRNSCLVVASPDARRVVLALLRHLADHAGAPEHTLAVQALALVRDGRATLVPTLLEDDLRSSSRALADAGIQLLDSVSVHVDVDAAEVVVGAGLDVHDAGIAKVLDLAGAPRRTDPPVPAGRYPIKQWAMMELWSEPGAYSRATATRRAALLLRGGPEAGGPGTMAGLAALFARVPAVGINPSERIDALDVARRA